MKHPKTINDVIECAAAVVSYADRMIASELVGKNCIDIASGYLLCRILELAYGSLDLLRSPRAMPVAVAVLVRSALESYATLAEILDLELSSNIRNERAKNFIKFGEYSHVQFFKDDIPGHRASLSPEEAKAFDRRIAIRDEIAANPSADQKKQKFLTWNGKSITATVKRRLGPDGASTYSLLCLITHGDASMAHKSIKKGKDEYELCTPSGAAEDAAGWVRLAAKQLLVSLLLFLDRHMARDLDAEALTLLDRVGLPRPRSM